ncbi:MAG: hypothetical protein Q9202_006695 [Teloschistes flavicans]
MVDQVKSLAIESWTLYPFGILLVAARIASRCILFGSYKKLQIDDWIMLFVCVTFTGVIVSVNQVSQNLSNYLPPGVADSFTKDEHDNAVYGSKFVMILEEFMLANTWLCKACLLFLYYQMTKLTKQNKLVIYVAAYCVFGYLLTQILYLAVWCRPISQYWRVPVDNSQCASYYHHLITAAVFNISSDLMMLYIPLPILIKAQLPLKRKIILCGVFSLGILVILSAILNRYYNFTAGYGSLIYLNWYVGEAVTSVFVANVPHLWPLLSRLFSLGAFNSLRRTTGAGSNNHPNNLHSSNKLNNNNASGGGKLGAGARSSVGIGGRGRRGGDDMLFPRTASEEGLAKGAGWPLEASSRGGTINTGEESELEMGSFTAGCTIGTGARGGGGDVEKGIGEGGGIMKTVQIRQYSN